ncbi:MAG: 50S ribosomal protein L13 [bacterium]
MSQKTYIPKEQNEKRWVIFDARDRVLGRLATRVATVLRGKNKPEYTPHLDCGDAVVVINAADIRLTGNKLEDDGLTHHSGYIGGLKSKNYAELLETDPEEVVFQAVKGMIPKTRLGRKILKNLRVYRSDEHPHQAQQPVEYDWENDSV